METPNKSKGEHYSLRWNSYTNNLLQVILEHQHHESLVDVTLCCEGQFIKAHKLVLSACSEVFQEMFKIHDAQHPVILLNGSKLNHLKHILEFMYQGEVRVLDVDLEGVLALGESLRVKGLSSVKFKQQMPQPQRVESAPNSSSSSPNPSSQQNSIDCDSNVQVQPKDLSRASVLKPRGEINIAVKPFHELSDIKKSESSSISSNGQRKKLRHSEGTVNVTDDNKSIENVLEAEKNSRPTSAFMIFAYEWRNKLAVEHPEENNKEISVRLGNMWKSLSNETRQTYYLAARKMELTEKLKQPNGSCKPEQPKRRKIARRKTVDSISHLAMANLEEFDEDDDLQIVEVSEDSLSQPALPKTECSGQQTIM
ncbi:hypothetical protein NQ315_007712 [Exocentrus adspersus]|uniref:Uncharacterized protein n=1 Tax=Exocentrus adspersus TaxID=1586481 RepID=A0AAV8W8F1_9CUCU|nr:hypothetical protein NQ315_007712 [Exocentrus adspersus]